MDYRTPLQTLDDCIQWFIDLRDEGLLFHPEDDPASIVRSLNGAPVFAPDDVPHIRARIDECFALLDDPCQVALDILRDEVSDETRSNGSRG